MKQLRLLQPLEIRSGSVYLYGTVVDTVPLDVTTPEEYAAYGVLPRRRILNALDKMGVFPRYRGELRDYARVWFWPLYRSGFYIPPANGDVYTSVREDGKYLVPPCIRVRSVGDREGVMLVTAWLPAFADTVREGRIAYAPDIARKGDSPNVLTIGLSYRDYLYIFRRTDLIGWRVHFLRCLFGVPSDLFDVYFTAIERSRDDD